MKITEIINGSSIYCDMKKSNILNKNKILMFDTLFSAVNLSTIDKCKIIISEDIYPVRTEYSFKEQLNFLNESIINGEKIRIWTSHYEVNSYLLFLYICNYLANKDCNLYVVFSDEYQEDMPSPSMLKSEELEKLSELVHHLSTENIEKYSNEWIKIKETNSEMRIMENRKVKSVSFDYYDDIILNELKKYKETKFLNILSLLIVNYHIEEMVAGYLINRLIETGKIEIVKYNQESTLNNIIRINKI